MNAMNAVLFNQAIQAQGKPVLVEFWANWCVYCRRIAPALSQLSQQYAHTLRVGLVNIDEEPELARAEHIELVPTLILYRNGQALGSITAPESKADIEKFIRETLGI